MKTKVIIVVLVFLMHLGMEAQQKKMDKKVLEQACGCIKKIDIHLENKAKNESIKSCIIASERKNTKPAATAKSATVKNYTEIQKQLLVSCPYIKELITDNSKTAGSDKEQAQNYYKEGQRYSNDENYLLAIVEYSKAVKLDPTLGFAWDNMGIAYRQLKKYNEAIACYKKSLELDAKAIIPLQNMAIAYNFLKDYSSASAIYEKLIANYPKDPEGYYGAARMYFASKDYEKASDNIFKAYVLYKDTNSPYLTDAEKTIRIFCTELKKENKLEVMVAAANRYNIDLK